jgi:hypothetical protein
LFKASIEAGSSYPHPISEEQAKEAKTLARAFHRRSLGKFDITLSQAINNLRWADVRTPALVRSYRQFFVELERFKSYLIRKIRFGLTDSRV